MPFTAKTAQRWHKIGKQKIVYLTVKEFIEAAGSPGIYIKVKKNGDDWTESASPVKNVSYENGCLTWNDPNNSDPKLIVGETTMMIDLYLKDDPRYTYSCYRNVKK